MLVAVVASTFNRGRSLLAACFALMILLADQYTKTYQILPALMLIFVPLMTWILHILNFNLISMVKAIKFKDRIQNPKEIF